MLAGGFPCQDISVAGKGAGIREGTRSGLWFYFAKAIGILRPRYALIENVPALANRGLNIVLADLAEAGYDAEWFDLRASDFGALHRRERIFIVAFDPDRIGIREERGIPQGESTADGGVASDIAHNRLGNADGGRDIGEGRSVGEEARRENPEHLIADRNCRGCRKDGKLGNGDALGRWGKNSDLPSTPENQTVVADHDRWRCEGEGIPVRPWRPRQAEASHQRCIIANGCRERLQIFRQKKIQGKRGFSWCQDVRRVEDLCGRQDIPKPLFRGARDGIPDWVDRIRSLGNAVVPDCAEFIGELIMEHDKIEAKP